jgi:hypothetical protein
MAHSARVRSHRHEGPGGLVIALSDQGGSFARKPNCWNVRKEGPQLQTSTFMQTIPLVR